MSNIPNENKILFEKKLSCFYENGKKREIYIKFNQLMYKNKNPFIVKMNRYNKVELCLYLQDENRLTISIPMKVFSWLIDNIQSEVEKKENFQFAILRDNKVYTWLKITENFSQFIVNSDNAKCFGIFFCTEEKIKIKEFASKLKYLLNYEPNANLQELARSLYISVLADSIRLETKSLCGGCKDGRAEHDCNKKFMDRFDKFILLDHALNKQQNELIYKKKFDSIMSLLNLSPAERIQSDINLDELKNHSDNLLNGITDWFDNNRSEDFNFDNILEIAGYD